MSFLGGLLYQEKTSAKALTEIITNTTTSVLMTNSVNNSQSNIANNNLIIRDIDAGDCTLKISSNQSIVQKPVLDSTTELTQDSNLETKLKDAIVNEINTTSQGVQFMTAGTDTETINRNITDISTSIINSNIVHCSQTNVSNNNLLINSLKSKCNPLCSTMSGADFNQWFRGEDFAKLCTLDISSTQSILQAAVAKCITSNKQVVDKIEETARILVNSATTDTSGIGSASPAPKPSTAEKIQDLQQASLKQQRYTPPSYGRQPSRSSPDNTILFIVIGIMFLLIIGVLVYFVLQ